MEKEFRQLLRMYAKTIMEGAFPCDSEDLTQFVVRSNEIEGYLVDPNAVEEAIEGAQMGYPLRYIASDPHIYAHLAGLEAARGANARTVNAATAIHAAMGGDALDAGAPGILRSSEVQSASGMQYVSSADVGTALEWWENTNFSTPFERHTVYELIHPFDDGNGRSGRILLAADLNFDFTRVNQLIGSSYFDMLGIISEKYQGRFWEK